MLDGAELARLHSAVELLPYVAVGSLAHAPVHGGGQNCPLTVYRRALEHMVAGIGDALPRRRLRSLTAFLDVFIRTRLGYHPLRLVVILGGQLLVLTQHLLGRQLLLGVPRPVRRDLRRRRSL